MTEAHRSTSDHAVAAVLAGRRDKRAGRDQEREARRSADLVSLLSAVLGVVGATAGLVMAVPPWGREPSTSGGHATWPAMPSAWMAVAALAVLAVACIGSLVAIGMAAAAFVERRRLGFASRTARTAWIGLIGGILGLCGFGTFVFALGRA